MSAHTTHPPRTLDALPQRKVHGQKDEQQAADQLPLHTTQTLQARRPVQLGQVPRVELLGRAVHALHAVDDQLVAPVRVRGLDVRLDEPRQQGSVVCVGGQSLPGYARHWRPPQLTIAQNKVGVDQTPHLS